mmetsp:Transcript_95914/g.304501  ORF Transcript_95914/g.304501 Transcript_95914/m.304501 type:complete len:364 (+) Transcript_95914:1245-2336(+)
MVRHRRRLHAHQVRIDARPGALLSAAHHVEEPDVLHRLVLVMPPKHHQLRVVRARSARNDAVPLSSRGQLPAGLAPHPLSGAGIKDPQVIKVVLCLASARPHEKRRVLKASHARSRRRAGRPRGGHRRGSDVGEGARDGDARAVNGCGGHQWGRVWGCRGQNHITWSPHWLARGGRGGVALEVAQGSPRSAETSGDHEDVVDRFRSSVDETRHGKVAPLFGEVCACSFPAVHCTQAAPGAGSTVRPSAVEAPRGAAVDVALNVVFLRRHLPHARGAVNIVHEAGEGDPAVWVHVLPHVGGHPVAEQVTAKTAQDLPAVHIDVLLARGHHHAVPVQAPVRAVLEALPSVAPLPVPIRELRVVGL